MYVKTLIATALVILTAACASSGQAHAGGWRLNPNLCPDLREDRRDARVTTGRRDLREDRRDRRYVNCPASAWVYVAGRQTYAQARPAAPRFTRIYVDRKGHYYGVNGRKNTRIVIVR
ncbi:MAG: hypothetical protein AAF723_08140 [Pseudomonadota bacterium]